MNFDGKCYLVTIFAVCAFFRGNQALVVKISIPQAVLKGHEVVLQCSFDLDGDKLYSVKWYHNSQEFYRYTPNRNNRLNSFNIRGFHVNEEKSNATHVVLKHATRAMNGQFSCEVTEDQPSFFTDMGTAFLEVVDPPTTDPVMIGAKQRYKIGDYIKTTCSSDKSDPAVNLTWYINGRQIDSPHVRKFRKTIEGNYVSSYSTLQFGVTDHLFDEGKLRLRCTANIFDVWQRSVNKTIELRKIKHVDDEDSAPAWVKTTSSTEYSHEKYWLYIARDSPDTTELTGNGTSSAQGLIFNNVIFFASFIYYAR